MKRRTTDGYMVSKKEMIKEHKRIIPKLEKAGEEEEEEKQEKELKEIKKK
jgi:hypothetical protein